MFFTISDNKKLLKQKLQKETVLVDVRTEAEFLNDRMENAINIPLTKIPDKIEELKGKENIILYCRTGSRSKVAKDFLLRNGLTTVLNGGNRKLLEKLIRS